MKEYRVYLLDGDGKIASACWVEAPTLRKAIAEVSQNFGSTCEVWNGAERLAVVHPLQVEKSSSDPWTAGQLGVMRVEEQLPSATRLLALAGLRRVRGVALGQ